MELLEQLRAYVPCNRQEESDKEEIIRRLESGENLWTRDNKSAHLTASCWITDSERKHILMCYHKIYDSWSWLGGHADGEHDLLKVALKEAQEESGIENVRPLSEEIYSLEILTVDGHEKRGEYVSSHLHLNVTYLLEADMNDRVRAKEDENSGVSWFEKEEAIAMSSEPWFRERIYRKLNDKMESFLDKR